VRTQVLSSLLTARPPAMCGKATLAMAVSSNSMKVAKVTVIAIIHGLMGFISDETDWSLSEKDGTIRRDRAVSSMRKGERTRQEVVAEAAKIFNQRGYEGSSILDIMQATNLQKGGIYRHFSSKQELAEEAFDYAWKAASESRLGNLNQEKNAMEKIKRFIANFVEVRPPVPGGCPLMNTAIDSDDGNIALRKRAIRALREWRTELANLIDLGIQNGGIRPETEPETVATIVIACLEGALMMSRLEQQSQPLVKAQKHLYDYLDNFVQAKES